MDRPMVRRRGGRREVLVVRGVVGRGGWRRVLDGAGGWRSESDQGTTAPGTSGRATYVRKRKKLRHWAGLGAARWGSMELDGADWVPRLREEARPSTERSTGLRCGGWLGWGGRRPWGGGWPLLWEVQGSAQGHWSPPAVRTCR